MTEGKRTVTVQVHEADEKPSVGVAYVYMQTSTGWEIVCWYGHGWSTVGTIWPIFKPGPWVELKDIAEAVEGTRRDTD